MERTIIKNKFVNENTLETTKYAVFQMINVIKTTRTTVQLEGVDGSRKTLRAVGFLSRTCFSATFLSPLFPKFIKMIGQNKVKTAEIY